MAGAGYKLFNTGDVLSASDVNTYMMQQTVMVFANASARTSALSAVLAEGMVSYLQDTNALEVYDGSAWVGATGDITGLTAGTGVSITSATGPVPTVAIDTAVVPRLGVANTFTTSPQQINGAASAVGLIVRANATTPGNLQEWQTNAGTTILSVSSSADLVSQGARSIRFAFYQNVAGTGSYLDMATTANTAMIVQRVAANVGFIVRGAASQTANLQEWQTSGGVAQSYVDSAGNINFSSTGSFAQASNGRAYFRVNSATVVPLTLRAAASQTANLTEWQDSSGNILTSIASNGQITSNANMRITGTIGAVGGGGSQLQFQTGATPAQFISTAVGTVSLVIKGIASQTANLTEWQTSAGVATTVINSGGRIYSNQRMSIGFPVATPVVTAHSNFSNDTDAARIVMLVRGAASQTANLQEWQNSSGTALATVEATGIIRGSSVATNTLYATLAEESSGGRVRLAKMSTSATAPGTDLLKLYVVAGTNAGTLKLVVRAGASGAETTILDNIPQ